MNEPEPDALLYAQTFFDMRPVYGDNVLFTRLQSAVVSRAPQSTRFLSHLAKQCQTGRTPIGFFRDFVLETEGEHEDTLDLKAGGIIAIVQITRMFALSKGLTEGQHAGAPAGCRIRPWAVAGERRQPRRCLRVDQLPAAATPDPAA